MRVGSLFSGIGGLDLGLERAGMQVAWQCEIDPYCRAVLAYHWPGVPCYEDIHDIDDGVERVDLVCGGFPCQPVSLAGKGLAQEDPRWLWPQFARVVGLLRPRYVLVENVPGLVRRGLGDVVGDLAAMWYDAEWQIVSAASVGAPHLRERVFVVAYRAPVAHSSRDAEGRPKTTTRTERERTGAGGIESGTGTVVADADGPTRGEQGSTSQEIYRPETLERLGRRGGVPGGFWATEPDVGRVADGVPNRVAQLRALGNAVVPQVAELVGRFILEAEARAEVEA